MTELTGIGAELRRARESQGLTLADVAQQLKFAPHQIEFLENERFDRLPGPTIARGMVRNYAKLLNLEPESLVARMSPKVAPAPDATLQGPALKQPVPFSDGGGRSTWIYAGFSLAVLALAAVLGYEWQQERATPQFVAPVDAQRVAEPEPRPVEPLADPAPPPAMAEAPKPEPKPEPKREPKPEPKLEPKIAKPEPKSPKPEPKQAIEKPAPPQVATAPQSTTDAQPREAAGNFRRIVLVCEEDSWLEVRDGTGRSVVQSLYPAGSERVVRGRGPFEIVIGNARAVRLLVDDKPVDLKRHTRGEVARVVIQ